MPLVTKEIYVKSRKRVNYYSPNEKQNLIKKCFERLLFNVLNIFQIKEEEAKD